MLLGSQQNILSFQIGILSYWQHMWSFIINSKNVMLAELLYRNFILFNFICDSCLIDSKCCHFKSAPKIEVNKINNCDLCYWSKRLLQSLLSKQQQPYSAQLLTLWQHFHCINWNDSYLINKSCHSYIYHSLIMEYKNPDSHHQNCVCSGGSIG